MSHYTLIGVDPGLVQTGVVAITLDSTRKRILIDSEAVVGGDFVAVAHAVQQLTPTNWPVKTWIEQYRIRGSFFQQDSEMTKLERELRNVLPNAILLNNMGSKKIINTDLMKLFNVWNFPTTNHRDLQAAARIALFGAVKDSELNKVLTQCVIDHVAGNPWQTY